MVQYPDISPIAFHLGPLRVWWYGLMYLFGFIAGRVSVRRLCRGRFLPLQQGALEDLLVFHFVC